MCPTGACKPAAGPQDPTSVVAFKALGAAWGAELGAEAMACLLLVPHLASLAPVPWKSHHALQLGVAPWHQGVVGVSEWRQGPGGVLLLALLGQAPA